MDWIVEQPTPNYHIAIREFSSGLFEAVTKLVKPMRQEYTACLVEGRPVVSPWDKPIGFTNSVTEKTPEQIEAARIHSHHRNVARSRKTIRWLCKELGADRLLTLTYRENMEDREKLREDFQRFLRLVRKVYPDWPYVAVPEKQDRGAYHIHLAVRGWQRINFLRRCWYQALGGTGNERGTETPGQIDVKGEERRFGARLKEWRRDKLASYIGKYLHKTFDESHLEKRRYWSSKGIQKPEVRRQWVFGASMFDAIKSSLDTLYFDCGLQGVDFDWWVSPQNDVLFIQGRVT